MLPAVSAAICWLPESAESFERLTAAVKLTPAFVEWLNMMTVLPGVSSSQTTFTLPELPTAIRGLNEKPDVFERFTGVEKVTPPSVERLNRMFELVLVSSSHAM